MIGFIARRLNANTKGRVSRPAIVIATAGVAVGIAVMVLTVCIALGFKSEIHDKVHAVGGDFQIMNICGLQQGERVPLRISYNATQALISSNSVTGANRTVTKPGCLKTDSAFIGLQFVGYEICVNDSTPDVIHLDEGEIIISEKQAQQLKLNIGDKVMSYFFDKTVRARRFVIKNTYRTNLDYVDNTQAFVRYNTIRDLLNYSEDECDFVRLYGGTTAFDIQSNLHNHIEVTPTNHPTVVPIEELHPQVFSWLSLMDINVWIILGLMLCVSAFTMASGLLILILERTQMIGLMKAIGARFSTLRQIFLYIATLIFVRGMIIGNLFVLLFVFVQKQWHIIKLNPTDYYIDAVPIEFSWMWFVLINVSALVITIIVLLIPTYIIGKISPIKAMRFD